MSSAADLVRGVLDDYSELVRGRLRERLRERRSPLELYRLMIDYPERGGRTLRAGLCLASAEAHGAPPSAALETAVSLELFHNAFLVHDDIQDDSELRRGQPTLHRARGVPAALNAGDALGVLGMLPLLDNCATLGPSLGLRILREAHTMARETVEGQALELAWRDNQTKRLTQRDYLKMIFKKTCWYTTIYPCRIGGLIATRASVNPDRFLAYGFFLGAAFQLQDDLLNLIGDEARYGKELNGDLLEGKQTLMLIHFMNTATPRKLARARRFLALPRATRPDGELHWLRDAVLASGAVEYARAVAHGLAGAAERECEMAFGTLPDTRARKFLQALPSWVIERS